jgi:Ala-tRNA(Pro) deacylase
MPSTRLKGFLDANHVKYVCIAHSPAYTAQEIATLAQLPGKTLAKTVMFFIDTQLAMAVVPASLQVSVAKLTELAHGRIIALATEDEFRDAFPDCETGAMPPIGSLYHMPVYLDQSLCADEIIFNAGSHRELVKMPFADFGRLVKPVIGRITVEKEELVATAR